MIFYTLMKFDQCSHQIRCMRPMPFNCIFYCGSFDIYHSGLAGSHLFFVPVYIVKISTVACHKIHSSADIYIAIHRYVLSNASIELQSLNFRFFSKHHASHTPLHHISLLHIQLEMKLSMGYSQNFCKRVYQPIRTRA